MTDHELPPPPSDDEKRVLLAQMRPDLGLAHRLMSAICDADRDAATATVDAISAEADSGLKVGCTLASIAGMLAAELAARTSATAQAWVDVMALAFLDEVDRTRRELDRHDDTSVAR
jgi:hypothetical protein